jgi:putative PIN family toxin of toxin-antitoxin system
MKPLRVVLDTNVYIAAALNPQSILYQLIEDSAAQYLAEYYTSPEILAELQEKLEDRFNFKRSDVVRWITQLEQVVSVIRPQKKLNVIEDDPDDNKILECAIEAKADIVVSADKHLYKLKEFKGIKIIHTTSLKYVFPQLKKPEN